MTEKRFRKANFSSDEIEKLISGINENQHILFGKLSLTIPPLKRELMWKKVLDGVNSVSTVKRDVNVMKHKWKKLKKSIVSN